MSIDSIGACLLVLLGASVSNMLDEMFQFTPKLSMWLGRLMDL